MHVCFSRYNVPIINMSTSNGTLVNMKYLRVISLTIKAIYIGNQLEIRNLFPKYKILLELHVILWTNYFLIHNIALYIFMSTSCIRTSMVKQGKKLSMSVVNSGINIKKLNLIFLSSSWQIIIRDTSIK